MWLKLQDSMNSTPKHTVPRHAEFASNNHVLETTTISPLLANYRFHLQMSFDAVPEAPQSNTTRDKTERQRARDLATKIEGIWEFLKDELSLLKPKWRDMLLELQVPGATRCRPRPTSLRVQQPTLWLTTTLCD
jgi:hypothetical protein